mgnify:CR=1 FL=1
MSRVTVARFASSASLPDDLAKKEAEAHANWLKTYVIPYVSLSSSVWCCVSWYGLLTLCVVCDISTETFPIYEPDFYWTLEYALPPLMELHQFAESPVIIEVQNRDPDASPDDH